jgi:hypothetical protein
MNRVPDIVTSEPQWDFDLGAMQLYKRRLSANVEDDHFDSPVLNAKWSLWNGGAAPDLTSLPGWMYKAGSNCGIIQPYAAGDWTIEAEVLMGCPGAASYTEAGIILSTTAVSGASVSCHYLFGQNNNLSQYRVLAIKKTNNVYTSVYNALSFACFSPTRIGLRANKTGTTYTFYYSLHPERYGFWNRTWTGTLGITPAYFGIAGYGYFNYFLRF